MPDFLKTVCIHSDSNANHNTGNGSFSVIGVINVDNWNSKWWLQMQTCRRLFGSDMFVYAKHVNSSILSNLRSTSD